MFWQAEVILCRLGAQRSKRQVERRRGFGNRKRIEHPAHNSLIENINMDL